MAKPGLKSLLLAATVLASGCAVLEPSLPAAEIRARSTSSSISTLPLSIQ